MSEDETTQTDEAIKATHQNESESEEEAEDLESLFAETSDPQEGETLEEIVKRQGEELSRIRKGVAKHFTKLGEAKAAEKKGETKSETVVVEKKETSAQPNNNEDLEVLFFGQKPEAELVKSDLKTIADKLYGGSVLKAWNNESWLRDKASSQAEAKTVEEKNKAKISPPSDKTGFKGNINDVKAEDVHKLTPAQKTEWVRNQANLERNRAD